MKQKYENTIKKCSLTTGGIEAILLESGNIYEINKGIIRLNQLTGNNLEPTASNIYLRVISDSNVSYTRLIGVGSPSKFKVIGNQAYYIGEYLGVKYDVCLSIIEDTYFFTVNVDIPNGVEAEIYYGMDVAIHDLYAVRNNEAYVCQYINHSVAHNENGYTIMSRQNSGKPHYLEQGSLTKNIGYTTDGYQFFGCSYKLDNTVKVLETGVMPNEIYQYEFAYAGLQSAKLTGKNTLVFYGSYLDEHKEIEESPILVEKVKALYQTLSFNLPTEWNEKINHKLNFTKTYPYVALTSDEINALFPNQVQKEYIEGNLASFFSDNYAYVTVGSAEAKLERPIGHILLATDGANYEETLASTVWNYGVFNSQIVCGNTSFNKYSSNSRNALNVQKISGQRMFIKLDGTYRLLTTPALFETGLNYAKWYYKVEDDLVIVETIISHNKTQIITKVKANKEYEFVVSEFICMAPNEYENPYFYEREGNKITFLPHEASMAGNTYPNLVFTRHFDCDFTLCQDELFYQDGLSRGESLVTINLKAKEFTMDLVGDTFGKGYEYEIDCFECIKKDYIEFIDGLLNNLHMHIDNEEKATIESFEILTRWYTHNMLVHLTSPHGLEQYSGAAWGTRDVCQGPAEYFLATNNFATLRRIILHVYSQQYQDNGNWPQWFMIDKYFRIQQHESHGDIIVWPLRLVSLYLERTKDYSILNEMVSYTEKPSSEYSQTKYTLKEHIDNEVDNIIKNYLPNTSLSCYGGGDWDDTLQPANHDLASSMVSGWTVALTYEVFTKMAVMMADYSLEEAEKYRKLAKDIKADYEKYLIVDGIPAGFAYFNNDEIKYIIHPSDNETGMKYRLLPLNRGIVAELFEEEMKDHSLALIQEHLLHPDGVRLMDKTVPYHGGINTYFMRAETAANFGREIGLQYCHAHIRYCEALAKIGHGKDLLKALLMINPVSLHETVKNALPRQRNCYFSSSDGNFLNRYEAMAHFDDLKTGDVGVKGGWRVYSSGPGIYINQIISHFLGIRVSGDNLILDPVLAESLDGLHVSYEVLGHKLNITYVTDLIAKVLVNGKEVEYETVGNKYRQTGIAISLSSLDQEVNITVRI